MMGRNLWSIQMMCGDMIELILDSPWKFYEHPEKQVTFGVILPQTEML